MPTYETVTAVGLHSKKAHHSRMVRAGERIELSEEDAERLLELGAIKEADDDGDEVSSADDSEETPVELPERPSNGATKDAWRTYLAQLAAATDPEMDEPLSVPDDATRDQMIQIGDARVAAWNEG